MAAEYIVARGNRQVVLCERGIRTFETMTRNTFDINAIPMLKQLSHLPVFADPSHGVGVRHGIAAVARAAVAAGADGLLIEVHPGSVARALRRRAVAHLRRVQGPRWPACGRWPSAIGRSVAGPVA